MKLFPARSALILAVGFWGFGCGESVDGRLTINLVPFCEPSLAEIQQDIAAFCIRVEREDGTEVDANCSGSLENATLKVDETSESVLVVVEGLDSTSTPVVRGRSVPVTLKSGEDNLLSIPIARVGIFAKVAGSDRECSRLPLVASDHAATVFPSGHVLISGSSSRDADSQQVALLLDPVSGKSRPLATPVSLHRAYHSASLLDDGRVVMLGGGNPLGVAPREIVVANGGAQMMEPYSFTRFDPLDPPLLTFEVLANRLLHTRTIHHAALFHGDQIIANDGEFPAEMFVGEEEASGYVTNPGGLSDPFPVSNQRIVTTVVPLEKGRAVVLGGEVNHNGMLAVSPGTREVEFLSFNLPAIRRNKPAGVRLSDGRVMFLGGKEGVVGSESPVIIVDPAGPSLFEVFLEERTFPQRGFTATLIREDRVFVVGGISTDANYVPGSTFFIERRDPDIWYAIPGPPLRLPRTGHTASLLPDGRLLVVGGLSVTGDFSHEEVATSAEIIAF